MIWSGFVFDSVCVCLCVCVYVLACTWAYVYTCGGYALVCVHTHSTAHEWRAKGDLWEWTPSLHHVGTETKLPLSGLAAGVLNHSAQLNDPLQADLKHTAIPLPQMPQSLQVWELSCPISLLNL